MTSPSATGASWRPAEAFYLGCPVSLPHPRIATFVLAALLTIGPRALAADGALPNGFPADPDFFPLGVWLQWAGRAPLYQAIGINTIVGQYEGPTEAQLGELAQHGMYAVVEQNDAALASPNDAIIKGWMQGDEPDNAQPVASGQWGPCIPAAEVARRTLAMKARDPTRPVMLNFGRGVADETWPGRGPCTGDVAYYDTAIVGADILTFDIYPVASDTPHVQGRLEYVARGVANLKRRATDKQAVWGVIETTAIQMQQHVTPAELRTEVWMALIHGATGIVYFAHEWTGGFREDGIFRHPEIVAAVGKTNEIVRALAPVLNSPTIAGQVAVSSTVPIATLTKRQGETLYLFAVAMQREASTPWFAIRGLRDGQATVIDEDRTVAIKDGILEDSFPGYGVHLCRIVAK
jgi:hypothetical protein